MFILETTDSFFNFLTKFRNSQSLIIPIYSDVNKHPKRNTLCLLYIYLINYSESFILPFNHTEALNLPLELIFKLDTDNDIYVFDKKKYSYFNFNERYYDADLVNYFQTNRPIDIGECDTEAHSFLERQCYEELNINTFMPLVKHFERCENIKNLFMNALDGFTVTDAFKHYNTIINNLYKVEKNGMYVDYHLFNEAFKTNGIEQNLAMTEYNVYTSTGRPSNRFNGINYNALNKEDGSRTPFRSRFGANGYMVQFDYDAFHLRLIGELIGYKFPTNENIHIYLGKQYFGVDVLDEDMYNESKGISFKLLYGGITEEYMDIPFFNKVSSYIDTLWTSYNSKGYVETPLFKRKLYKRFLSDMNKNKIFNYVLQAAETEQNSVILSSLHENLKNFKSKIILYCYDSFLFDFDKNDGVEFIHIVNKILSMDDKFTCKLAAGLNYNELKAVDISKLKS